MIPRCMILNGECSAFNPLLMEFLVEVSEDRAANCTAARWTTTTWPKPSRSPAKVLLATAACPAGQHQPCAVGILHQDVSSSTTPTPGAVRLQRRHQCADPFGLRGAAASAPDPAADRATSQYFFSPDDAQTAKRLHATTPQNPEGKNARPAAGRRQVPLVPRLRPGHLVGRCQPGLSRRSGECHPVQDTELPDKGEMSRAPPRACRP